MDIVRVPSIWINIILHSQQQLVAHTPQRNILSSFCIFVNISFIACKIWSNARFGSVDSAMLEPLVLVPRRQLCISSQLCFQWQHFGSLISVTVGTTYFGNQKTFQFRALPIPRNPVIKQVFVHYSLWPKWAVLYPWTTTPSLQLGTYLWELGQQTAEKGIVMWGTWRWEQRADEKKCPLYQWPLAYYPPYNRKIKMTVCQYFAVLTIKFIIPTPVGSE